MCHSESSCRSQNPALIRTSLLKARCTIDWQKEACLTRIWVHNRFWVLCLCLYLHSGKRGFEKFSGVKLSWSYFGRGTKEIWVVSNDIFSIISSTVIIINHKISRMATVYRAMCQIPGTPKALVARPKLPSCSLCRQEERPRGHRSWAIREDCVEEVAFGLAVRGTETVN